MGRRWISVRRQANWRQAELPFLQRSRRLDRAFKVVIVVSTISILLGLALGTREGRNSTARLGFHSKRTISWLIGAGVDRSDFEAQVARDRRNGIELVRGFLGKVADDKGPTMREFLQVAGMDRDSAVLRWGNVDWTLALSSKVFEPEDSGRSYQLKPNTRSIWLINLTIDKVQAMFEIPDTPEARRLGEAVGGRVVPESLQTTNSWGCRGPEPDPNAAVRGIVLGDSTMQGLLVGDDQTPPIRLESALRSDLGVSVSILNTGHLGYSPEQYYHTLIAYYKRFRPRFVIISICGNDFGDMTVEDNWAEGEYWLDLIVQFCRTNGLGYLAVPVPLEPTMLGRRDETLFPGKVSRIYDGSGLNYLNPIEEFTTEHLQLKAQLIRDGLPPFTNSPLFNGKYNDKHLSPLGCDLWARIVARRLELMWAVQNPVANPPGTGRAPSSKERSQPGIPAPNS
jgi:hypothetical protein